MADRTPAILSPLDLFNASLSELAPEGRLGLAVSGGSDSMALLAMARIWSQQTGHSIAAVTIDHGLRAEAADEARMVAEYCSAANIPHATLNADLGTDGNIMAAAREARYQLMSDWAGTEGIEVIALGHTMDDQAETVLMRLGRGAGIDGLSAMTPVRHWLDRIWIRPFLGLRRAGLQDWLRGQAIAWIDDPTNQDTQFDRIKIRQALDVLEPLGITVPGLAEAARRLRSQRQALDYGCAELIKKAAQVGTFGEIWLDTNHFADTEPELQRRLLSAAIVGLSGRPYPPRHRAVSPILKDIADAGFAGATLGGCLIRPHAGKLLLCREPAAASETITAWQHSTPWDNRWRLHGPWSEGLQIAALGSEGLAHLRHTPEDTWRPPSDLNTSPKEVLQTLPSIWAKGDVSTPVLASVPPLNYVNPDLEEVRASWTASRIVRHDDPFA